MSKKTVWELIERSTPLHLEGYRDNEFLIIRVLYNKVDKKKYVDIRIYEINNGIPKKTDKGTYFPLKLWENLKQCLNEITRRIK